MPLKAEGITIIVVIFVVFLLMVFFGIYCHFCAEVESGGHNYGHSHENIAVTFTATDKESSPLKKKCKCSNRFKGYCRHCSGDDFVDDGEDGKHPDFSNAGGAEGLDPGWGNKPDPIRSALGGGPTENATGGGDISGGGGGFDSGIMRDG